MSDGTKLLLTFLGGAIAGAAGLAALNRNKLDFGHMKPLMTGLMSKSMVMKDAGMSRMETMKEDLEDMAAEAREQVDEARMQENLARAEADGGK
ncbi:MAG: hypothetical protein K2N07_07505 [Desulfovibrio sp.]|nr:hypothetical protein [Desulfovibrio sp.]